ncbi:MAG: hypothetical protein BWK72_10420 [Rhodoferax ferrireducens]|uniref:DUF2147 domain-containing protein n=2 Tax=Pseudomonadota TaxID=1224 RepID=A0A1Y1QZ17_9GAMM|nr:MAG: hypothetical protein BWK72_10420 [Rhodoferax ferrireducens]OQX16880.1 MAG: hypothetical protein BWK73_02805 [Thiothrix lacustris]
MTNRPLALICKGLIALITVAASSFAAAQMTPVGNWHSFDEKTGELKSLIVITESGGALSGRIEQLLRKNADQKKLCTECTDDRKDKPVLGMEIIRGAKKVDGKDVWEGGKILDPENGKDYTLKLTPIEDGKKLEVRGSVLFIGRTQTWVRVQ